MSLPRWWRPLRHVVTFTLGVLVILEGLYGDHDPVAELIVGSILVGILPADDLLDAVRGHARSSRVE